MKKIARNPNPEPALFGWRDMLWSECRTRKWHACWLTASAIPKGERAYRPITNGQFRMERLGCIPPDAKILS